MTEQIVNECLRCKEITTFCDCAEGPICDARVYIALLEGRYDQAVRVATDDLAQAIEFIGDTLKDLGGCDHSAGICFCNERSLLRRLEIVHYCATGGDK